MRFKMDKEDVELFNLAFIGLGILVIIVIASIVLQPDGYKTVSYTHLTLPTSDLV